MITTCKQLYCVTACQKIERPFGTGGSDHNDMLLVSMLVLNQALSF
jgi:hypothetical protein